jgi:hypothetical protein
MRDRRRHLDAAARALIQAANRAGGDDNITAILFELVDEDEPDETTREYVEQPSPDEEDTLHPEDHVAVPPEALAAVDEQAPQAGLGRRLLALAVIVALSVAIVVLVWWGLAR